MAEPAIRVYYARPVDGVSAGPWNVRNRLDPVPPMNLDETFLNLVARYVLPLNFY